MGVWAKFLRNNPGGVAYAGRQARSQSPTINIKDEGARTLEEPEMTCNAISGLWRFFRPGESFIK